MEEAQLDMDLYADFWHKMQQSKFDIDYYDAFFARCVSQSRWVKYSIIFITSITTGVWMEWNANKWVSIVCPIIILLLQAVSAISEHFPFESRKSELRELSNELNSLYIRMASDWRKIRGLECSNAEINSLLDYYQKKQVEIKSHYFKDDALPQIDKVRKKAENKTEEYFKVNYESENQYER